MCELCDLLNSGQVVTGDEMVAIVSLNTVAPAIMVLPKQHANLSELPKQVQDHLFITANNLSSFVFDALQVHGTNSIIDDSSHASITIVGRSENDNLDLRWKPVRASPEELQEAAKRIQEEAWYIGKEEKKPAPSVASEEALPPQTHEPKEGETAKDVAADIQKKVKEGPKTEHNYLIRHLTRRR